LVYGTSGYGKTWIVAATATLFHQEHLLDPSSHHPVIYIPCCDAFERNPFFVLRNAAIVAFSSNSAQLTSLVALKDLRELVQFLQATPLLIFVDQVNQLKPKSEADTALSHISEHNRLVRVVSVSDDTQATQFRRRTNTTFLSMFGPVSEVNIVTSSFDVRRTCYSRAHPADITCFDCIDFVD
jgi:Cdc6-like AAA superfamily ATPase